MDCVPQMDCTIHRHFLSMQIPTGVAQFNDSLGLKLLQPIVSIIQDLSML